MDGKCGGWTGKVGYGKEVRKREGWEDGMGRGDERLRDGRRRDGRRERRE